MRPRQRGVKKRREQKRSFSHERARKQRQTNKVQSDRDSEIKTNRTARENDSIRSQGS